MLQHALDLAVLALAQAHRQPDVAALLALELGLDAEIVDAVDGDAVAQAVELLLRDLAMRAHAVAAQPARRGQFQHAREAAVVGEKDQALGVDVEPADRDDARQVRRKRLEDRRAPLGVLRGGDEAARLVEREQARALRRAQRLAVDAHVVGLADVEGGAGQHLAVDGDAPLGDPGLGVAARAQARPRHHLGDALTVAHVFVLLRHGGSQ